MSNPFDSFKGALTHVADGPELYTMRLWAEPGSRAAYRERAEQAHDLLISETPDIKDFLCGSNITHSMGVMSHYVHMGVLAAKQANLSQATTTTRLTHPDSFAPLGLMAEQPLAVARRLEVTYGIKEPNQPDAEKITAKYYSYNEQSLVLSDMHGQLMDARLDAITQKHDIEGPGCPAHLRGILHSVHNLFVTMADRDEQLMAATLQPTETHSEYTASARQS